MSDISEKMDDGKIIDLYIKRDEMAILYTRSKYGEKLKRIAMNLLRDFRTAAALENDTYLKTWQRVPPDEPRSYFFTYLSRIIRFDTIDVLRKMNRDRRTLQFVELTEEMESCIPSPSDVESEIDAKTLSHIISTFLRGISPEKRNVFLRRYFYMDPVSEIAKRYSLSESKIRTMLFRIRNDLKEYLRKEGYEL